MPWVAVGAVVAVVATFLLDKRRRAYADLATTPAAAVYAGRNEVVGRAWVAEPLVSHRSSTPSIWWEYTLEEERTHTRTVTSSDGRGGTTTRTETYKKWHQIDRRQNHVVEAEVVDDSGSVAVRVAGASIVERQFFTDTFRREKEGGFFARMFDNATGRYRETERGVAVGDTVFVVGEATFDEVRAASVLTGDVMISTRSEDSHVGWLGAGVLVAAAAALCLTVVSSALIVSPEDPGRPAGWLPGLALAGVVGGVWWVVATYNRLRLVAQGVDRAWSLLDVQLRRRHDLIPALVEVVRAHGAYEQAALVAATNARTAMETEAARQTGELRQVLAVAEAHPELTSDDAFRRLQTQLADTEGRIAGTRTFYNSSLTLLRDRCERFPSSLIARRVPLEHRELISAEGFERTVPAVERTFA